MNFVDKVVVCDDGSFDNTSNEAKKAGAEVIRNESNKGKGRSLKMLFDYARKIRADIIVTIDGDGQFLPEEIGMLIKDLQEKNSDIVVGYRFDDKREMPRYRKMGNKFLDKMTNLASDLKIKDSQSGFRIYSKKAIDSIHFLSDGFAADSEILIDASKKGLKISETKVTVLYNTGDETSTKNPVSHFSHVLGTLIEIVAIQHPLKYLGTPGLVFVIIGMGFLINMLAIFNEFRLFSLPQTLAGTGFTILGAMLILVSAVLYSINRVYTKQND